MSEEPTEVVNLDSKIDPVPLTIYIGGERIVVGAAVMASDGSVTAMIDGNDDPRVQTILENVKGEFRFGLPRIQKPVHQPEFTAGDLPYDGPAPKHPDDLIQKVD